MASSTDALDERAREFVARFTDEAFADAAELLSEDGQNAVVESFPEEFQRVPIEDAETAFRRYWYGVYAQYGAFGDVKDVTVEDGVVTVDLQFALGSQPVELSFDDGAISDVSFPTAYTPPEYADRSAFSEREVTVDAGDVELGGTLTVPSDETPVPGVLLVHGAGIHDRDGTAGESKILKDFAWGLASRGVAVLRYEKRLLDHEDEIPHDEFDLDTVVIDDAVHAVDELASAPEVDADSVFVAGHSQGGMCAPSIAERHGGVAGIVSLDGPADTGLDEVDFDYVRYSIAPDGELTEAQQEMYAEQRAEFERAANGDYDEDEPCWATQRRCTRVSSRWTPSGPPASYRSRCSPPRRSASTRSSSPNS
ncbi:alpha/beta hydrolase [Halobacterium wangiae]|uniref:alpha/beta hydrolase n=1 Tax=Halobacterium wangiae TaxID=2902623 RepID=UPI001E3B081F|nr:alpha/beta fold hydrolase [Halobacterium wangiae]